MIRRTARVALLASVVAGAPIGSGCAADRAGAAESPAEPARGTEAARAETEPDAPRAPEGGLRRVFPFIWADAEAGVVEIEAEVSGLIDPGGLGRTFYIEQFVCRRSTKEHESPVVTDARPAHIHAALLLAGFEPGRPVTWSYPEGRVVRHPAFGDALDVTFVLAGGDEIDPRAWVIDRETGERMPASLGGWVFAGSAERERANLPTLYEADGAGTVVGLAAFGTEVIAWSEPVSHEEGDGELEWVADEASMPEAGSAVRVRVTRAGR